MEDCVSVAASEFTGERSQQRSVRMSGEQTHMQCTNITSDVIKTKAWERVKPPSHQKSKWSGKDKLLHKMTIKLLNFFFILVLVILVL